ncbi:MAG: hypothetical protein ACM3L6_02595 [Deltaproteobacteria bacterium]
MKDKKISNIVALAVTLLAVVTAVSFSLASVAYQREVTTLRRLNTEQGMLIQRYKLTLENIQKQLAAAEVKAQ